MTMHVEADLFSGRPNPRWELDAAHAASLSALLSALSPGSAGPEPPGLGFRGFVIHDAGAALPGCGEVRAYRGAITALCGGDTRHLADEARGVERFLLEAGRSHLDPAVVQAIEADLPRP